MCNIRTASLARTSFVVMALAVFTVDAGSGQGSTVPAAEFDALPPVGKGQHMVKPNETAVPEHGRDARDARSIDSRHPVPKPLSREIVPPSYRYGTPGYLPDGRGGRGYDFGYPGYREQGGGGYPHQRPSGIRR